MYVTCHKEFGELQALAERWNELAEGVPLRRFEWLGTWWQHFGRNQEHVGQAGLWVLEIRNDDDETVGLAPWYQTRGLLGQRVARFLGSGIVCTDYQTILCHDRDCEQVIDSLATWLIEQPASGWNLLELTAVDEEDQRVRQLVERLKALGCTTHSHTVDNCWRVNLPASWEEYVETLSYKKRAHVRRAIRQMFDTNRAQLHVANTPEEFEQAFAIFRALHQKRRQAVGDPGCFSDETFAAFLEESGKRFFDAGRMDLLWIEWDGQPAAAEFNPCGGGVIYGYQGGIEPDLRKKQPGPGNLINIARIRRAIERGDHALDFLRGDEPYKLEWQPQRRRLVDYRVVPRRAIDQLCHQIWLAERCARTWGKRGLQKVRERRTPRESSSAKRQ